MTIDRAGVFEQRPSGDLQLDVASPAQFGEIEAVSRAADRREVFSPLTAPLLTWFLDRNPCGPGFVVVARDRPTAAIVGHFVFYRWTLRQRTNAGAVIDVPAALYVRLYVDRTVRRRGVFAAMTRFGLARLAEMGVPVAYTAPNPRSSPGFVKFGMQRLGPLPFRVRPAVPGWGWIAGAGPAARGITVERRERFDAAFDVAFESSLSAHVSLWSPRTAALLNWRYGDRPDVSYETRYLTSASRPIGYLVTRRMSIKGLPVLALCDFWTEPGRETALRVGVEDALGGAPRVRGAIAIGAAADPRAGRTLQRAGFVRCPAAVLPQPIVIFGGAVDAAAAPFTLPDEHAWYLTPYDWDVF